MLGIVADDPPGLLAAMLERMQAEGNEIGGIGHARDPEHATFFMQLVIVEGVAGQTWTLDRHRGHGDTPVSDIEVAASLKRLPANCHPGERFAASAIETARGPENRLARCFRVATAVTVMARSRLTYA
ncbi:hypothetical protein PMES_02560 [Profundibacterium mesophilum KAUST100406-0324]|uniref:Uncharacterized protein n=1 Tax=Profundibacterium mesophilum KAUST100406-0324 TaxID=1037889 RepID=A0A921TE77_9RHOB|nr:hypothetical protein PMES_02560 [Profundibacterium mesophilum KAUST100406-0324]